MLELLKASVISAALWLALTLLKPLTRRFLSQTWHYYMGMLPALCLFGAAQALAPVVKLAMGLFQKPLLTANSGANAGLPSPAASFTAVFTATERTAAGLWEGLNRTAEAAGDMLEQSNIPVEALVAVAFALWITGCVAFIAVKRVAYIKLRRSVLQGGTRLDGLPCPITVFVSHSADTPMLIGFFKPILVLPSRQYTEKELAMVISHELIHLRRRDLPVKLALLAANAVHWFNPFAYLVVIASSVLCEHACDEAMTHGMDTEERRLYGELILSTLEYGAAKQARFSAGLCAEGKHLKRRLMNIMIFKKTKLSAAVLSVALALIMAAGSGVLAYAAPNLPVLDKGYVYTAPSYTATEDNHNRFAERPSAYPEITAAWEAYTAAYVRDPNEISMEEAAAVAAKALTEFYGLCLDGETLYVYYSYPREDNVPRLAEFDADGNIITTDPEPLYERLDSPKWKASLFIDDEDGAFWEYYVYVEANTGELWNISRVYWLSDEGYGFIFKPDGHESGVAGSSLDNYEKYAEQHDDATMALVKELRAENDYTRLASALAERTMTVPGPVTSVCTGLWKSVDDDNHISNYFIDVLVTAPDGTRALFSFTADTMEFMAAKFTPLLTLLDKQNSITKSDNYISGF